MNNTAYLTNGEITLRATEPEDLEVMYRIENDTHLWEVSSITVPYSRYALKQYIETTHNDLFADRQLRLIIEDAKKEIIGAIDLTDFDPLHNRAAVGIVVLKEYHKKGYATQALSILSDYCKNYLHLNQLYAYIPVDNKASISLFKSSGFNTVCTVKEWIRTEKGYKDAILSQIIFTNSGKEF